MKKRTNSRLDFALNCILSNTESECKIYLGDINDA